MLAKTDPADCFALQTMSFQCGGWRARWRALSGGGGGLGALLSAEPGGKKQSVSAHQTLAVRLCCNTVACPTRRRLDALLRPHHAPPSSPRRINQNTAASREETADTEVISEDESVVFTPLLCNNQDRGRRGTKGNDGLYTAASQGPLTAGAVA